MARPSDGEAGGETRADSRPREGQLRVRYPAVAGTFYPAEAEACRRAAEKLLRGGSGSDPETDIAGTAPAARWLGGIVPHAGWICSGAIAGEVIATLARQATPDLVVVFAAIHTPLSTTRAALASFDRWIEPTGASEAAAELSARLLAEAGPLFARDDRFHIDEHAVEVELPLIQAAWPAARVLPVEVPVSEDAVAIGERTARAVEVTGVTAVYLASSDLTHYGPAYRFAPAGEGLRGLSWAKDNDRRLLDVVTRVRPEAVVPEVRDRANACGGGAIAAMLAACRAAGAARATVLRHANSYETLAAAGHRAEPDNAVGYAGVVVGR